MARTDTNSPPRFVESHESICTALYLARDEGLLLTARDNCEFYEHRDWSKSADRVNAETTAAHLIGGLLTSGVEEARKRGIPIEDLSDPATRNYNLIRVADKDKKGKGQN